MKQIKRNLRITGWDANNSNWAVTIIGDDSTASTQGAAGVANIDQARTDAAKIDGAVLISDDVYSLMMQRDDAPSNRPTDIGL